MTLGVAWALPQHQQVLQTPIQATHNWPGGSSKNEQNIQAFLVYNQDDSLPSRRYSCEGDDALVHKRRAEFFEIFLDKQALESSYQQGIIQGRRSIFETQKLVSDYLRQSLAVEFISSVPTRWERQEIINIFKDTIRSAEFGTEGPRQAANVKLTESEAAAKGIIKSSTISFVSEDTFLSVEAAAGGWDNGLHLGGIGIGSTRIDQAFLSLVNNRLSRFPSLVEQLPPDCAQRLANSERLNTMRYKLGERVYESPTYKLLSEGDASNLDHSTAGVELGRIIFTWEEIQSLFDPHAMNIAQKSYMVLSGGVGSSRYVRDCIQHKLMKFHHPYAPQIQITQAQDAQLVVAKSQIEWLIKKVCGVKESSRIYADRYARNGDAVNTNIPITFHLHEEDSMGLQPVL
ncbi:hypothetical protein DL769_008370 [Monosporascus sp. CRB-8-3]|nr:hypothetical protein DL769_008370 [Monosporascus sp. CRB-8-3]